MARSRASLATRTLVALLLSMFSALPIARAQISSVSPGALPLIGTIDDRYQSYNVEMITVTGGDFWKPYPPAFGAPHPPSGLAGVGQVAPASAKPELYQYRPPLDLESKRLRSLAGALGPAFIRVSGTWANTTYFPISEDAVTTPPAGFTSVLTHARWKALIAFAHAAHARIVTSFAISTGTRDSSGAWTTEQAKRFVDFTRTAGGRIAAAEFMNEPALAAMNGAPPGYTAEDYGRDVRLFSGFMRQSAPETLILGPGSIGGTIGPSGAVDVEAPMLPARDLLVASRPVEVDAFSYHHYGALSLRCAAIGAQTSAADAMSEQWLSRTSETLGFYRELRNEFAPGKPIWLTETADAACGGNPWARTFLDTFRYLDQLGRLAKQGVEVVMHNTLVESDYGLLDEDTFAPRPNYWAALLWRKLMGSKVLESGVATRDGLHLYAHCLRGITRGVVLLAINNSRTHASSIALPQRAQRYTLSASEVDGAQVLLNGHALALGAHDEIPDLDGEQVSGGTVELVPATITFIAVPEAANSDCE